MGFGEFVNYWRSAMSERKSATVTVEMLGKIMDELAQKNLSHEPGRSEAESSC